MIRISSTQELLEAFRTIDRDDVQIAKDFRFPMTYRDYLAWPEPSGHRMYLVFQDAVTGVLRGVVFQRTRGSAEASPAMCQWCHSVRPGQAVSLMTAAAGPNRRVGVHLCSDLNCRDNVFSTPGIHDFHEGFAPQERLLRVLGRMVEFSNKNLF